MIMIHFEMNLKLGGMIHWINSVYVHPFHRQRGVFTIMYNHVRTKAQEQATLVKCIRLYVDLDNVRAQEVYRRLGMRKIEECFDFFENDYHFL